MKRHHSKQILTKTKPLGQLLDYHYEIQGWNKSGSVLFWEKEAWIRNFYSLYGKHLNDILTKIRVLNEKYYITVEGEFTKDKDGKEQLQPNMKAEDYDAELKPLLNEMIVLK